MFLKDSRIACAVLAASRVLYSLRLVCCTHCVSCAVLAASRVLHSLRLVCCTRCSAGLGDQYAIELLNQAIELDETIGNPHNELGTILAR